jgi:rod shape-determining protein MreC
LHTLAAQVIGSDGSEASHTIILDKGSRAGLRPDLPVIVSEGVIGKVLRVFADTSQVLLITDANSGVASLLESSRVHGVLRGQNRPLARLTYVANGEAVEVGETLVTSGEDRIYPKGLPLGVVVSARPSPEFQEIEVQPLAQLNRLEEVLVVLERETISELPALSRPDPTEAPRPNTSQAPPTPEPRPEAPEARAPAPVSTP